MLVIENNQKLADDGPRLDRKFRVGSNKVYDIWNKSFRGWMSSSKTMLQISQ